MIKQRPPDRKRSSITSTGGRWWSWAPMSNLIIEHETFVVRMSQPHPPIPICGWWLWAQMSILHIKAHPLWLSCLAILSGYPIWLSFLAILSGLSFLAILCGYPVWLSCLAYPFWLTFVAILPDTIGHTSCRSALGRKILSRTHTGSNFRSEPATPPADRLRGGRL